MISEYNFKLLFNQVKKAAMKHTELKSKFDGFIKEKYGYHYSDKDLNEIIDTLDYGTYGLLTFDEFDRIMKENK